jgi:TRAP transporter 4TM/12TM fusion protein
MSTMQLDEKETKALEEKFDHEVRFRHVTPPASWLVAGLLFVLSMFHYYTAGFGLLREVTHRGVHMAFVIGLVFLVFPFFKNKSTNPSWHAPGGIPWFDWLLALGAAAACLYVPYIFEDLAFRVGNPSQLDVAMGTILVIVLLEGTRRSMGWPLPVLAIVFMAYAYFGKSMPGILQHPGADWGNIVNHLYLTSQGVYGIALGVVATYVFHFVLFGVLATRIGLGQLFIDLASCVAGKYAGGPAKVAIFGSAAFGTISGSSIANTVTVGSLTIPAMIRLGYPRHFAAAVESTASTGGQITPPVMGAAAFLMVEFLNLPYQQIVLAAIIPAFMHFFGVFMQVHFEAKRHGLRGLSPEELPNAKEVIKRDWPTIIPLILLVSILMSGRTPYMAAFYGITGCIVVGLLNPRRRIHWKDMIDAFITGAKYALAVGVAAATVGIIVGVVTLTGVGFKISYVVTSAAGDIAGAIQPLVPWLSDVKAMTLFFTLLLTGIVCILMGCGIPTTANYIIMVTVAAPALGLLGVAPIVAHFFVFYYGVLADITPPVALAAYAAASMAGADPFKTGNTAFRLGLGKALVPFVFAFAPSMLIVAPGFTWSEFWLATLGCAAGIVCLSAALSGYLFANMRAWERWLAGLAAVMLIAPSLTPTIIGIAMMLPVIVSQWAKMKRQRASMPA